MNDTSNLNSQLIKLYRTEEHACGYLPKRQSRTLFLDPELTYTLPLYEQLTHSGFRRSGQHLYRPDCADCKSCIPVRVVVEEVIQKRKFRRIMKMNSDIDITTHDCIFRQEDYVLFESYIEKRHADGDMYPATEQSYKDFLIKNNRFSFQIRMTLNGKRIGVAVTDRLESGLSAIYTFFDPHLDRRSLGVFSILHQIELCKQLGLPYLYLGYWVPGCQKMDYKTTYQPTEFLINEHWQRLIQSD